MRGDKDRFYPARDPDAGLDEDRDDFLRHARISLGLPGLFYGSLREPRMFELVVGRPLESTRRELVTVPGHSTCEVRAGPGFPGIFPADTETDLRCVLVSDLSRFEQTLVAWFEWNEYALQRLPLADGRVAQAFVPDLDAIRREYGAYDIVPWSFERWRADPIEEDIANARDWMRRRPDDRALAAAGFFALED